MHEIALHLEEIEQVLWLVAESLSVLMFMFSVFAGMFFVFVVGMMLRPK